MQLFLEVASKSNTNSKILSHPISQLGPDLTYNDNLIYHYTGGMVLAALKRWAEADECFEIIHGGIDYSMRKELNFCIPASFSSTVRTSA